MPEEDEDEEDEEDEVPPEALDETAQKGEVRGGPAPAAVEEGGGEVLSIDGDGTMIPDGQSTKKDLAQADDDIPWYQQVYKEIVRVVQDPQTIFMNVSQSVKESMADMEDSLLEYGPPYSDDYGGNLFMEVNNVNGSPMEIHILLVCGANPNLGDPEDSNTTPIHFAAYHVHLKIMKMLKRAGGNIDIGNDLGQRPLGFACLHNHKDRKKEEIEFLEYLLEEGVEINHTDKAGYRAIDYAAMNGNLAVVTWLLQHGAKVLRTNDFLWIPRHDLLDEISNVMVKEMIRARLEEEAKGHEDRLRKINEMKAKAIREERSRKATAKLDTKMEAARLEELEKKHQEELALMDNERKKQAASDRQRNRQWLETRQHQLTTWKHNPAGKGWFFQKRNIRVVPETEELINSSKELLLEIERRKKDDRIFMRWKEITGMEKGHPFRNQEEEEAEEMERKNKVAQLNTSISIRKKGKRRFSRPANSARAAAASNNNNNSGRTASG